MSVPWFSALKEAGPGAVLDVELVALIDIAERASEFVDATWLATKEGARLRDALRQAQTIHAGRRNSA
jgi:hypothetical protein